jgi:hypothetical protein
MRTLKVGFTLGDEQFAGTLQVPDHLFDERGIPTLELHKMLEAHPITYDRDGVVATDSASLLEEHKQLTGQVAQLTQAVHALVKLQAIANQKLDTAIKGNADCAVL